MLHGHEVTYGMRGGAPRIWFDHVERLNDAGFEVGNNFTVETEKNKVTVTISDMGSRTVAKKEKKDKVLPIVDLNNRKLLESFSEDLVGGKLYARYYHNKIVVTLLPRSEAIQERETRLLKKLENGEPLEKLSLFTGSGFLDNAIEDGLKAAGIASKTVFANELDDRFLSNGLKNNPSLSGARSVQGSIAHLHREEIPLTDISICGFPCVGFSKSGKSKNRISSELEHEKAAHLFIYMLGILLRSNSAIITLENVPEAMDSVTFGLIEKVLSENGYNIQKTIINSRGYGALEERRRVCLVAVSENLDFDLSLLQETGVGSIRVGDIMDEFVPETEWSTMQYLKDKQERDRQNSRGFAMHIVTPESDRVSTLGAGYAKIRSTESKVQHPTNPDLLRQFSPQEHARIKGYPESFVEGLSKTVAHCVLGNGVVKNGFQAFATELGRQLKEMVHATNEKVVAINPSKVQPVEQFELFA